MPNILDLSNELLHRIVQAVPRNDLLSLSLACKWLHALCDKSLKRHLALKKYSTVTFGEYWAESHEDEKDAMLLIDDIIRHPEIMEYPESMWLGRTLDVGDIHLQSRPRKKNDPREKVHRKRQSVITHRFSELEKLIEDCVFILEQEKKTSFAALCNPKNEGVAVSLALTMLPNLKRITTQDWMSSCSTGRICSIVTRIAETNQDPQSLFHNKALADLQEFFMGHYFDETGDDVNIFIPFAMLPSMRYLGGIEISSEYTFIPHLVIRPGSSLVAEINFLKSAISAESFDKLLCGITALRKFTYHHAKLPDFDCQYEVRGIVRLLRKYAASSLQHLDIVVHRHDVPILDMRFHPR